MNGHRPELEAFLREHPELRTVDALFFDLCGVARGKRYPREELGKLWAQGLWIARSIYVLDALGDCPDALGLGFSDGDPDASAFPVEGTLVPVPWADPPRGQVLMRMFDGEGVPCAVEPRVLAERMLERLRTMGLRPVVAFELEFYLFAPERASDGRPQPPLAPQSTERERSTQVYGLRELDAFGAFLEDVAEACRAQRLPASVATKEYAPGQFEINLYHVDDALRAADHCALLRHLVRGVARRHGLLASFMAKPSEHHTGNGMHVHMSLLDERGENLFAEGHGEAEGRGSVRLRQAIAGMQATLGEAMAIFAPNVNSYRRFVADAFVPVNTCWGINNRSVAFRVPSGEASARRVEHRVAGADANPYLVLAVLLASVHHGLCRELDPGPASEGNASRVADPGLPWDWASALAAMREGTLLREYLGASYVDLYCAVKRAEARRFGSVITGREYDWYL